jgi:hypothetical protein
MSTLPPNIRCEVEDFADDELAGIIRNVFDPAGRHSPA